MALSNQRTLKIVIITICVVVPLLVGVLYILPADIKEMGLDTSFLPVLNAIINSTTSILLVTALVAVKKGNYELHKKVMLLAMILGGCFLISYVVYHATTVSVVFGDLDHNGSLSDFEFELIADIQTLYRVILISHILLSIIVLPFVLFAVYFGLTENNAKHKKIVRFAFPFWFYVSVTGVIIYFMISPYYV